MTVKFFARMLSPNVKISFVRNGKVVGCTDAGKIEQSKYKDEEIKDFRMGAFKPAAFVKI